MLKNTLIGLFVGTSLSLGGLFINSAGAQTTSNLSDNTGGNLSDVTGGNLSDITGTNTPAFTQAGELSNQIITQGEQSASGIIRAFNRNSDIRPSSNDRTQRNVANSRRCQIRRFSLDKPEVTNNNCSRADNTDNSESEELNALLNKADEFLEDIDRQVETANRAINNRLW